MRTLAEVPVPFFLSNKRNQNRNNPRLPLSAEPSDKMIPLVGRVEGRDIVVFFPHHTSGEQLSDLIPRGLDLKSVTPQVKGQTLVQEVHLRIRKTPSENSLENHQREQQTRYIQIPGVQKGLLSPLEEIRVFGCVPEKIDHGDGTITYKYPLPKKIK